MSCWALTKCPDRAISEVAKIPDSRVSGKIQTLQLKDSHFATRIRQPLLPFSTAARDRVARQVNVNVALAEASEDVPMASMS
jgi:hypothetical protein